MKHFFRITQTSNNVYNYKYEQPGQKLMRNIQVNWLQSIHAKTYKNLPVYLNKAVQDIKKTDLLAYGIINHKTPDYEDTATYNRDDYYQMSKSLMQFDLIVPQQDIMQYFVQWQRYRKYWWSSITTTPSLFSINDMKYEDDTANVDIVAQFDCGKQTVETITIRPLQFGLKDKSCLTCTMGLETAVLILLLDGLTNNPKDEYLRLHRKMAPYKVSFALKFKDSTKKQTLSDLAKLLHNKLELKKISSLLPDISRPLESQIKENLQIGVPYTAVLNEGTLENGIFGLLNSSTRLEEQVHVADFHSYAAVIC